MAGFETKLQQSFRVVSANWHATYGADLVLAHHTRFAQVDDCTRNPQTPASLSFNLRASLLQAMVTCKVCTVQSLQQLPVLWLKPF